MSGRPRRKEQPFRGVQGSKVHKAKHKFSSANDRLQRPPKPLAKKTAEDFANERNQGSNSIDTGPKYKRGMRWSSNSSSNSNSNSNQTRHRPNNNQYKGRPHSHSNSVNSRLLRPPQNPQKLNLGAKELLKTLQNDDAVTKIIQDRQNRNDTKLEDQVEPMNVDEPRRHFRPVVIDGCNICFSEGLASRDKTFNAQGLTIAYDHFKQMGYADNDIIIIMAHVPNHIKSSEDEQILKDFKRRNILIEPPSRKIEDLVEMRSEWKKCDDDLYLLKTAKMLNGLVLSNDQFRKEKSTHPEYGEVIDKRLLIPRFIRGKMILPDDPLGPGGPRLEEFLTL